MQKKTKNEPGRENWSIGQHREAVARVLERYKGIEAAGAPGEVARGVFDPRDLRRTTYRTGEQTDDSDEPMRHSMNIADLLADPPARHSFLDGRYWGTNATWTLLQL